mmetsp:Transcript_46730/g.77348  ORF Transcript_46730/g.77348 Transcript_46730/m.77348 type:complete len:354 (+) Transcript_46730:112-1173(+)
MQTFFEFIPSIMLFLLIAGMAGSIDPLHIRSRFTRIRGIAMGLICQFIILPLLGLFAASVFPLDVEVAVTLLIVTTSPGGGFSGWWCSLCNADLALSIAMTTASTLFALVALPINAFLYIKLIYGRDVEFDWVPFLIEIFVVISAVLVGMLASHHFAVHRSCINKVGQIAGVMLMLVGAFTNGGSDHPLWRNSVDWYVAVSFPCVSGLIVALGASFLSRLSPPESVTVAIECCYQNTGLALTIALAAFPRDQVGGAAGVPVFYGIIEIILIPLLALAAWKLGWTYAPAHENVCVALIGNYQPSKSCPVGVMQLDDKSSSSLSVTGSVDRLSDERRASAIRERSPTGGHAPSLC